MKRSDAPRRRTPLARARTRLVKPPERDWSEAIRKVQIEGSCRVCGRTRWEEKLEAAHVIGRAKADETHPDGSGRLIVRGVDVVPLCAACHRIYDARTLDLLPYLTGEEQARAVQVAGGILSALHRLTGRQWRPWTNATEEPA